MRGLRHSRLDVNALLKLLGDLLDDPALVVGQNPSSQLLRPDDTTRRRPDEAAFQMELLDGGQMSIGSSGKGDPVACECRLRVLAHVLEEIGCHGDHANPGTPSQVRAPSLTFPRPLLPQIESGDLTAAPDTPVRGSAVSARSRDAAVGSRLGRATTLLRSAATLRGS